MNKKIILLPFLAVGLLAGCTGGKKTSSEAEKPIWEQPLVEGETSIDGVKETALAEGYEESYFKVRGTVAWNSGSTLSLYRGGKFIYCYNFNSDAEKTGNEELKEHKLGSYVEIYAKATVYSGSVQLTPYISNAYDPDAYLHTIQEKGEEFTPKGDLAQADYLNANAGAIVKAKFVPAQDYELAKNTSARVDYAGVFVAKGEGDATVEIDTGLRCEQYVPEETQTALYAAVNNEFGEGNEYDVVGCLAAVSVGKCRVMLGEGSSLALAKAKQWPEPTGVTITAAESATSVEVDATLQLSAVVAPEGARQKVTWESSDPEKATVDATGKVRGVAAAASVTITAKSVKTGVEGTYVLEVKAAAPKTYTVLETFRFSSTLTAYEAYNETKMNTFIKGSSNLGSTNTNYESHTKASGSTTTAPLIGANGGSGDAAWKDYNLLKLGSASKDCTITLNFKDTLSLGKVVIKAVGWPGATCNLTVGDSAEQLVASATHDELKAGIADESVCGEYTFTFGATHEVAFAASRCVMITSIVVYTVA